MTYTAEIRTWDGLTLDTFQSCKPAFSEAMSKIKNAFGLPIVSHNRVRVAGLIAYCFETPYRLSTLFVVYHKNEVKK